MCSAFSWAAVGFRLSHGLWSIHAFFAFRLV